jgi:uncharacterized protein
VAMRPPMPNFALSRRVKIAISVVVVLIVLLIVLSSLTGVYINWLWFGSVGYRQVYRTMFWTRLILFLIFGFLMALIIGGNLLIAYRVRPPFRPMSAEQQNLERYRVMIEPRKRLILAAVAVIAFLTAGLSAQGKWAQWLLWFNGGSFHVKDPQFGLDISFYAWDYPVYRILLGFGFTAIIFSLILSIIVHYLAGSIRLQTPGPKITPAARRHLTILVFVFMVFKAMAYWLDRYGLVFSNRSKFTGASYTDVHADLPAKTILFWIAIIIAAGVLGSLWLKSSLLPGIGFVSMLILSILISGIYPALVQQISVKPNASSKEAPYISDNIQATRAAYGIQINSSDQTTNPVSLQTYAVTPSPATTSLSATNPTVNDIRILDPNILSPTFTQQQQIQNVYGFPAKLDVDRYTVTTNGTSDESDYIVGVRELDKNNLQAPLNNWINQHTVYTHGNGFVAAPANLDVTNNASLYTEANIPSKGPLGLSSTGSEAYYGELLPDYSIVGASGTPQEFNGRDATKITYQGGGGVSLGSFFTRLALAVNYKETNFVLNDAVSAKGAKIIFDRDPRQMVQKVAPFLTVDGDPYPFVDSTTGDITWMVDGYTTMSNYPYSERNSLATLTNNSLSSTGKVAGQPNESINYIRNSVKATVDAYTGKVTLYDWDPSDPILNAWKKIFPGLITNQPMPAAIQQHVRYPEDLFEVQRSLLGTYHVDNPVQFYNASDKWTVPIDPNDTTANQPPYYVLASPPSSTETGPAEFQLTSPMIVNGKQNLAAYISVDSDYGPDYGKFTVLTVPTNTVTNGPEQVSNILTTNPTISRDLTQFNGAGGKSSIVAGNLLTLPIGNSFLYVEPLYLEGEGNGSYPTLGRVLVVYGDKTGYAPDLAGALLNLSQPQVGYNVGTATNPATGPTTSPSSSASSAPPSSGSSSPVGTQTQQQLLASLNSAYASLQNAYKTGNPTTIASAEAAVFTALNKYLTATGPAGGASTAPSSGASSPSPSTSK